MITDNQTDFLYLADSLPKKYPAFFNEFEKVLHDSDILFELLSPTEDVWAVDYMPVQIEKNRFVQFIYDPDYLHKPVDLTETISDVDAICKKIDWQPEKTDILLDGGNVVKANGKVIITDKVFSENRLIPHVELIKKLEEIFHPDAIIIVPQHPLDYTGHADGIVRFLNENTVLINASSEKASKKEKDFESSLRQALNNAGLKYREILSNTSANKNNEQANGEYLNYLQMKDVIILPAFGIAEDEMVMEQFIELFPGNRIVSVNSNEIANDGGILNCISWNILK
jgi:agmatine deiminase